MWDYFSIMLYDYALQHIEVIEHSTISQLCQKFSFNHSSCQSYMNISKSKHRLQSNISRHHEILSVNPLLNFRWIPDGIPWLIHTVLYAV